MNILSKVIFYCSVFLIVPSIAIAETSLEELANMSFEELDDIVTTVSKKPESSFEATAAVFVLSSEDIRLSGATSLPEVLRLVPGIEVARVDSTNWAITSRGLNDGYGNKLLVLIDGRSVYSPLFSGVYWDLQDVILDDINRIEVIRGPGATLWGANAVNGVINIITKHSKNTQGFLVTTTAGKEEKIISEVRYGGTISENAHYRAYVKYFERDSTKTLDGLDGGNTWDKFRGGFRTDFSPSDNDSFTIQGDAYTGDANLTLTVPVLDPPYEEPRKDVLETEGQNVLSRWQHRFADNNETTLQVYYDRYKQPYSIFSQEIETYDLDFQHSIDFGNLHSVVWGTSYRRMEDNLEGSELLSFSPESRSLNLASAFVQDKITLIEDTLATTVGVKVEHNDFTGVETQPSVRLGWTATERQFVWAGVSKAVKLPSRAENDVSVVVANAYPGYIRWEGNNDIHSEEVVAYELGYRANVSPTLTFDIATYYNDYTELRTNTIGEPTSEGTVLSLPFENGGEAEGIGFEFSANWKPISNWTLGAGYSHLNLSVKTRETTIGDLAESFEGLSPENSFNLSSILYLNNNIQFSNYLYFVENLPADAIPSYTRFDTRLAWSPFETVEFSVVGQNLFDSEHQEFSGPLQGAANTIPRSFFGKVSLRF